jgi:hypothetical protein
LRDQLEIALRLPLNRLKLGLKGRLFTPRLRVPGVVYDPRLLDDRGDQIGHKASIRILNSRHILNPIAPLVKGLSARPSGMDDFRDFCQWAKDQNIRVIAAPPPLAENPAYAKAPAKEVEARVRKFYEELGVPVLGVQEDWFYPVTEFYDTNYHLTEEAARIHSKRLADRLRTCFNSGR